MMIMAGNLMVSLCLNRGVLWEGPKELRHIPMGEEHPDVPVWHCGHPRWSLHDWRRSGRRERLLLRLHALGVLCSLWVNIDTWTYSWFFYNAWRNVYLKKKTFPNLNLCGTLNLQFGIFFFQFWPVWVVCTRQWWWSTQTISWKASLLQPPSFSLLWHLSLCLGSR